MGREGRIVEFAFKGWLGLPNSTVNTTRDAATLCAY